MALRFRLKDLAETVLEYIHCPQCGTGGSDDRLFSTDLTRVTFDGVIVVAQCRSCGEIFVPREQRLGVIDPKGLKSAVERDASETGEPLLPDLNAVKLSTEKLNAMRRGQVN